MNCQTFESMIDDLASERATGAAIKQEALLHTRECARCKSRITDQRELGAGLRALAASVSSEQVPTRVEEALLLSFRVHHNASSVGEVKPLRRRRQIPVRWAVAAAAAVVLAALAMAVVRMQPSTKPVPPADPSKQAATDDGQQAPKQAPKEERVVQSSSPAPQPKQTPSPKRERKLRPLHASNTYTPSAEPGSTQRAHQGDATAPSVEIATDFIPLMQSDLNQLEGGQLMRVELPRSALASFGFPINMNRTGERIKADVVVGNDGLARAIRFVH